MACRWRATWALERGEEGGFEGGSVRRVHELEALVTQAAATHELDDAEPDRPCRAVSLPVLLPASSMSRISQLARSDRLPRPTGREDPHD